MKEIMNKSEHINIVKVLTTILVVYAHAIRMYTNQGVITPKLDSALLANLTDLIYSFHMPLYMVLSGMVYGICIDDFGKYNDTLKFIKNKILRLVVPYIFWGAFYVAPVMVYFEFVDMSYPTYFYRGILLAITPRHLWFLIVLFEIFFVAGILKRIIQNTKSIFILMISLFVLCFFSEDVTLYFQLNNFCYYLFFFYLGYLFNKRYEDINKLIRKPIIVIILVCIFLVSFKYRIVMMGKISAAVAGSLIFFSITSFLPKGIMNRTIYKNANKNGFGIYLWHPMIIYILFYFWGQSDIAPVLLSFIITLIAYVVSWLLTDLLRYIKLGILLGE